MDHSRRCLAVALSLALASVALPAVASAQERPAEPPARSFTPATPDNPRVRFGIGYPAGFLFIGMPGRLLMSVGGMGLSAHVGMQLTERVGVSLEGGFTTLVLLTNIARAGVLVHFTPVEHLDITTGLSASYMFNAVFVGVSGQCCGLAVGVPLRIGGIFGPRAPSGARHGFSIALETETGAGHIPGALQLGIGPSFYVGLGLGYELY